MSLHDQQLTRQKRIQSSMIALAADTRFRDFIERIKECRENALANLVDTAVVQNERASCACIGEVAAYMAVINIYDEAVAQAAMAREEKA